jgi:hypothetical protein
MPAANQTAIRIATPAGAGRLSPARKKFNTLIKQVDAERIRLAQWRAEAPRLRALAAGALRPLSDEVLQTQVDEIRIDIMAFDLGIMPGDHKFPDMMLRDLREEIADMRADIKELEADLKRFTDIKKRTAWLREYEIGDGDDEPWF